MTVTLRKASKSDAGLLAAIHKECFPTYWNNEEFSDFFAVANTYAWLALSPEPAGMIVCRAQHEQADIITLAVLPAWRRQGIARLLLEKAMAHLASLGAERLFLDVKDGNSAAVSLYEAYGFSHVRRRRLYYRSRAGDYTDALVMSKKLS